jgi:hypothetical protein
MSDKMTIESVKKILPRKMTVTQELVDTINGLHLDPNFSEEYRDKVITYMGVLKEGNFSIKQYLKAVEFITYKMVGDSNIEAYAKTFPDRYQRMINDNKDSKYINSVITVYAKGELVQKILERTIIPPSITHRDLFYRTIEHLSKLAFNGKSEHVQEKACKTLIDTLKPAEVAKMELDMTIKENEDIVERYERALDLASHKMLDMINKGADTASVVNIKLQKNEDDIIDVEEDR